MPSRRDQILNTVEDLVKDFLVYNRKADEELPLGAIEDAVGAGEITVEDIVSHFEYTLRHQF